MNLEAKSYWLTRLLLERGIAVICLIAFIVALFVKQVPFKESPSLFYLFPRDSAFTLASWIGIVLSLLVITGMATR